MHVFLRSWRDLLLMEVRKIRDIDNGMLALLTAIRNEDIWRIIRSGDSIIILVERIPEGNKYDP